LFVQPYRSRAMLSSASSPFSIVGLRTSVLNSPHCCGLPYQGVCTPLSLCVLNLVLGCPRRCGLPCHGVRPPHRRVVSDLGVVCHHSRAVRTSALGYPHYCGMACRGVPPPPSSCGGGPRRWAALLRCSSPLVVVGCRTSALSWGWQRAGVRGISDGREQRRTNAGHDESRGPVS